MLFLCPQSLHIAISSQLRDFILGDLSAAFNTLSNELTLLIPPKYPVPIHESHPWGTPTSCPHYGQSYSMATRASALPQHFYGVPEARGMIFRPLTMKRKRNNTKLSIVNLIMDLFGAHMVIHVAIFPSLPHHCSPSLSLSPGSSSSN